MDDFFELGGQSHSAMWLIAQINRKLGTSVPITSLMQSSTIEKMAFALAEAAPRPSTVLVPLQPAGDKPPLFYVPPAAMTVLNVANLVKHLKPDQPLYGLQPRGLDGESGAPHHTVEEMAAYYLDEIRQIRAEGPYYLLGQCFGGFVVFEMAQMLRARGQEIGMLGILDTLEPPGVNKQRGKKMIRVRGIRRLSSRRLMRTLKTFVKSSPRRRKKELLRVLRRIHIPTRLITNAQERRVENVTRAHYGARRAYGPKAYPGKITCFWSGQASEERERLRSQWKELSAEELDIHIFPGKHGGMFKKPQVQELASKLKACVPGASGATWR